jgi:hypothetical protein
MSLRGAFCGCTLLRYVSPLDGCQRALRFGSDSEAASRSSNICVLRAFQHRKWKYTVHNDRSRYMVSIATSPISPENHVASRRRSTVKALESLDIKQQPSGRLDQYPTVSTCVFLIDSIDSRTQKKLIREKQIILPVGPRSTKARALGQVDELPSYTMTSSDYRNNRLQ